MEITLLEEFGNGKPLPLETGDLLTRAEFERRYEAMPALKKAELIEGVVYIPAPTHVRRHGHPHFNLNTWMGLYNAATPGVSGANNASVRLDLDNELQPDGILLIDPALGGQARISLDDFVELAPELVGEVASSSASIDLHLKLHVYCRNGVREYVVWRVLERAIDWFVLRDGAFERLAPDEDGIFRSEVFPGLWLDAEAMVRDELGFVLQVLQQGIASPEHAAFVERLGATAGKR
jgi:Uma2 family endonuclease